MNLVQLLVSWGNPVRFQFIATAEILHHIYNAFRIHPNSHSVSN